VRGRKHFEPGGRRFESVRAHFTTRKFCGRYCRNFDRAVRTADIRQAGSTTWPSSAKLDAAARSAAAVRSAAEDERRSREQSVRAHHKIKNLGASVFSVPAVSDHRVTK